jgi:hypothetical protein
LLRWTGELDRGPNGARRAGQKELAALRRARSGRWVLLGVASAIESPIIAPHGGSAARERRPRGAHDSTNLIIFLN